MRSIFASTLEPTQSTWIFQLGLAAARAAAALASTFPEPEQPVASAARASPASRHARFPLRELQRFTTYLRLGSTVSATRSPAFAYGGRGYRHGPAPGSTPAPDAAWPSQNAFSPRRHGTM